MMYDRQVKPTVSCPHKQRKKEDSCGPRDTLVPRNEWLQRRIFGHMSAKGHLFPLPHRNLRGLQATARSILGRPYLSTFHQSVVPHGHRVAIAIVDVGWQLLLRPYNDIIGGNTHLPMALTTQFAYRAQRRSAKCNAKWSFEASCIRSVGIEGACRYRKLFYKC